jgi:N-acetyl-gamma-glutamyl-phosphate reductase
MSNTRNNTDSLKTSPLGDGGRGRGGRSAIKIGIVGGAGYTGGELIRILLNHPATEIVFVHSKSNAGNLLSKVHEDLIGETDLKFTGSYTPSGDGGRGRGSTIDLLFLCLGHGEANSFLTENVIDEKVKIIDLSQDFRLNERSTIGNRQFVYGLPELNREKIKTANNIANPGCFATAIQLGLLPLANAGLLNEVYTTGITGSTGAGQSLSPTTHFSWRSNNIQAYKTLTHQHLAEIGESLSQLQPGFYPPLGNITPLGDGGRGRGINFVPWRGDFARGIFISSQLHCELNMEALTVMYNDFYKDHPFVFLSMAPIHLKQVVNTNKCIIQLEKAESTLVVHSVIDNLLKGASGQAVQNMNLMFGLDEAMGLRLKAAGF